MGKAHFHCAQFVPGSTASLLGSPQAFLTLSTRPGPSSATNAPSGSVESLMLARGKWKQKD